MLILGKGWGLGVEATKNELPGYGIRMYFSVLEKCLTPNPAVQWVKRLPTDLADRVRSSLEVKSSQP